ncbi:sensor histidine kinase [Actinoplanes rectilineatus]|uniref:sensor histidine kinase n=2 Tax=Actinoplanes TaxID=1865 RepID=UPI001FE01D4D|nr:nitrate- and nitrite sensing domain-containing protein [Actinoplanes rectilineatus]
MRLVLVPSVVAMVIWFAASGYLIYDGIYNRTVANSVREVSIPAVSALSSIQQERRLSISHLARPSRDMSSLLDQRRETDKELAELREVADDSLGSAPASVREPWEQLVGYLDQLPDIRSAIDSESTTGAKTYDFYNGLLDSATVLFDTQARIVPGSEATQGGITSTEIFKVSDLMSRAGSAMDAAFASGKFGRPQYLEFVSLVGAYHYQLDNIDEQLEPAVLADLEALRGGPVWQELIAAENTIITAGPWGKRIPPTITADRDDWATLTSTVSQKFVDITIDEADQVSAQTLKTGNNQLLTALFGSLIALTVAGIAILWAVRQSSVLVDRALSTRLAKLGEDAGELIDQRLPAVMDRLRRREPVSLEAEFARKDYGGDEIGQVAEVINRSLLAATAAAVDEAKARAAGTAMLMGVARRPQRPLQRGLKVIEDLQSQMGDEKMLVHLFDIHHQLNQTRRFLENLVILAGGQIGRRFNKPVPLRRVLLASFAEAHNYQRINLRGAADVELVGYAVAEVIHLMAELLDNALAFSPPGTTVWVTSNKVKHGVAIEIEDAGVGMNADAVDRANTLLATAPTPDVTELKDGSQVGLYVVAELAKREGVQVSLRRSAYGGLLAIVLLPDRLLVTDRTATDRAVSDRTDGDGNGGTPESVDIGAAVPVATPIPVAPAPSIGRTTVGILEAETRAFPKIDDAGGPVIASNGKSAVTSVPPKDAPTPAPAAPSVTKKPAPAGSESGTKPPLPHRKPQQHLAPELLEDAPPAPETAAPPAAKRSPEEIRNRFSRYQRGWADGQTADRDETEPDAEQGRNA